MTKMTRDALGSLITARIEFALNQLDQDSEYIELCNQQKKTEETAQELLNQLEKPDRITIRRHYEGELRKTNREIEAAYIQGLRDHSELIEFLSYRI